MQNESVEHKNAMDLFQYSSKSIIANEVKKDAFYHESIENRQNRYGNDV